MTTTAIDQAPASQGQPRVTVFADRCAGCQECVIRCPAGALSMDSEKWIAEASSELCVGCRQCERTCPFSAIRVEGPLMVTPRIEIASIQPAALLGDRAETRPGIATWDEAITEASRCLDCPDPTCVRGCPTHNDIPSFLRAIRDKDLDKAHQVLRRTTVLSDVCSRVCDQSAQCEGACSWSLAGGEPVAVGKLERFIVDNSPVPPPVVTPAAGGAGAARHGGLPLSVAIVGSGPAGIGAAWRLIEAGARVTVFERDQHPGGLLGWGIPDFTLPAEFVERPWRQLTAAGADLRCGTAIGPDDLGRLLTEHDAVIMANGAGVPIRMNVPGSDLDGVTDATSFLKAAQAALGDRNGIVSYRESYGLPAPAAEGDGQAGDEAEPQVLVLGAGNTAMDVARMARRLGLRAVCVDWVNERFALARPDELAEARHEGVDIRFLRTLRSLSGADGRVGAAELTITAQDRQDRLPKPLPGEPERVRADLVVWAMGYRVDAAFRPLLPGTPVRREAPPGVPDRRWVASGILANPASAFAFRKPVGKLARNREAGLTAAVLPVAERLWVAGDALVGPSTVVEAMAQGRRAAASILDSDPSRDPNRAPRRVLVAYESSGGRTAAIAGTIAAGLRGTGAVVRAVPLAHVGIDDLATTDLLVLGTWVEGFVVAKVGPAHPMRAWLAGLPRLPGTRVATFCTYAVNPRGTLAAMREELVSRGMNVVGEVAFGPGAGADREAAWFSELLVEKVWPATAGKYRR